MTIVPRSILAHAQALGGIQYRGAGFTARFIGDYNNDGFHDTAFSNPVFTFGSRSKVGLVVIVLGNSSGWADIDMSTAISNFTMRRIIGSVSIGEMGRTVAPAGDINQDGFDDVLISVPNAQGYAGISYVIFGMTSAFGYTDLDLATFTTSASTGFTITGPTSLSLLGYSGAVFRPLGDINGDSIDDFAVSAIFHNTVATPGAGSVWFIYGKTGAPTNINLATLPADAGVRIGQSKKFDHFGGAMDNVGDFNGDGIADFLIGASFYSAPGKVESGAAYLIYGATTPVNLDMRTDRKSVV